MWVAHQQSVPDRSAALAALPASPRQPGSVLSGGDPAAVLQPVVRLRTSVLVSRQNSFLFFDDPPAPAQAQASSASASYSRDSISSTGTGPFFLDPHAPTSGATKPEATADQRNDLRQQPWPPPRKESLSDNPTPWVSTKPSRSTRENIG